MNAPERSVGLFFCRIMQHDLAQQPPGSTTTINQCPNHPTVNPDAEKEQSKHDCDMSPARQKVSYKSWKLLHFFFFPPHTTTSFKTSRLVDPVHKTSSSCRPIELPSPIIMPTCAVHHHPPGSLSAWLSPTPSLAQRLVLGRLMCLTAMSFSSLAKTRRKWLRRSILVSPQLSVLRWQPIAQYKSLQRWQTPGIPSTSIFIFNKEDHTLGNMVTSQLRSMPQVTFAGYKVPHPLVE